MNNDQLEELEALSYIFTPTELKRDENIFEYTFAEHENLRIQLIWPPDYPLCSLIVSISDSRVNREQKLQIEKECNEFAESFSGSAATFAVIDFIKENLEKWNVKDKFGQIDAEEEIVRDSEERKVQLTKAQKRKLYKHVDGSGERPRGWNWVDIVSHVRSN